MSRAFTVARYRVHGRTGRGRNHVEMSHFAPRLHGADISIIVVMGERGYPMENFEQRASDISVDHAQTIDDYRAAHAVSLASDHGQATTEDLRQAMVHYRRRSRSCSKRGTTVRTSRWADMNIALQRYRVFFERLLAA